MTSADTTGHALYPLTGEQKEAVRPGAQVWLSASAGTGKTQVLTARVLRLLLTKGVRPENLLCITFTKAAAAEMADRINGLLARWVQMDDGLLFADLEAIGAPSGPGARAEARKLFARVLDAPGGGLQIMTIHSLAQSLLGSFPEEAGLFPGFRAIEGREQDYLFEDVLAELITELEESGRQHIITHFQNLSIAMGEEAALAFLKKCASETEVMADIPDDRGAIVYARRIAGVSFADQDPRDWLAKQLADSVIDRRAIEAIAEWNTEWGEKSARGRARASIIREWLALEPAVRAENFARLHHCWTKANGEPLISSKGYTPPNDGYAEVALDLYQWSMQLTAQLVLADYADRLASALIAGKAYALRYAEAKKRRGLIDFDDMIRHAAALLGKPGIAEWIRFKLDQRIDHILVDEAQDTNRKQWSIIEALSDDFFAGRGAKDEKLRTIFSVGDFKQAIFGFQGTDPAQYLAAKKRFAARIKAGEGELEELSLSQSFRSSQPVIAFVNALTGSLPDGAMGDVELEEHVSQFPDIGAVELLEPVNPDLAGVPKDDQDWVADEKRLLAERLADRVKALVDDAPVIFNRDKEKSRPLRPGDIMILLRSRGELASAIIGQLHDRGVAVAGIDRLKMQEPLAVQDMLAAIRFVLQPNDEYSLACLLVSPLIGWSHEKLLEFGYRKKGTGLWEHLKAQEVVAADIAPLAVLLSIADFVSPHAFLEHILSGSMQGRRKLTARLGTDSLIPLDELINLVLQFEAEGGGTLQSFLHWFENGETQITREQIPSSDEVRVMTVHGSKGLQAPVVILGDICSDPSQSRDGWLPLELDRFDEDSAGRELPLLRVRKAEEIGQLGETKQLKAERDVQEHLRLLYVAATRAEEHLIMTGSLGEKARKKDVGFVAPDKSWYPHIENALLSLGCVWEDDAAFGGCLQLSGREAAVLAHDRADEKSPYATELPDWLLKPAPEEETPPRPLAPSQLDTDDYGEAPSGGALRIATEKGRLVHMLFERISGDIPAALAKAEKWLERQAIPDDLDPAEILLMVSDIVTDPEYAAWFGEDALAEVPLAALVGETVISGRIDRMIVSEKGIKILDFKTGRHVPENAESVPTAFLRQMAHYVAAMEAIFPDHKVEAALLYSQVPRIIYLPDSLLEPLRPQA